MKIDKKYSKFIILMKISCSFGLVLGNIDLFWKILLFGCIFEIKNVFSVFILKVFENW